MAIYDPETVTECAVAEFDETGALVNADQAVGELVNTEGAGYFQGYYNDTSANDERMRHGMYWSGDLAYRDADGWIYLAGRTADWMRVDGENLAAAPIERILQRLPGGQPGRGLRRPRPQRRRPGDGRDRAPGRRHAVPGRARRRSSPTRPTCPRRAGRASSGSPPTCPSTATNKVLKRELIAQGPIAGDGELWVREERGTSYAQG